MQRRGNASSTSSHPGIGKQTLIEQVIGPTAAPQPPASQPPPSIQLGALRSIAPDTDSWHLAKAELMAGRPPPHGLLPATPGNAAGCRRLSEIREDKNLPGDVRVAFLADLADEIGKLEQPVADLHRHMRDITFKKLDAYLREGMKMPSVDFVQNQMGGLRRALSLKWLLANATSEVYHRASRLDPGIPPVKPTPKDAWGMAAKLVELVRCGRLSFDPMSDVTPDALQSSLLRSLTMQNGAARSRSVV